MEHGHHKQLGPREWKLRFAPNIGLNSLDTPMFRHSVGTIDALEHIAFIGDQGFAGIQDNFLKLRSPQEQELIGAALLKRNLAMGCFVANPQRWNQPLWVADDREARHKLESDLRDSIDAAKRTGGQVMTVLSGFLPGVPRAYQAATMIDNLRRLAPIAEKAGVILGLEACNSFEYPVLFLNHVRDAFEIAEAVNSPSVGLIFDIYHVQVMDGDILRNLERCWRRIVAIQFADNPGRTEAGSGELNWVNVFRYIANHQFDGLVEMEHEILGDSVESERRALEALRAINASI